jgi:DUF4097 and DUF4098 domain-containing protein YvlB
MKRYRIAALLLALVLMLSLSGCFRFTIGERIEDGVSRNDTVSDTIPLNPEKLADLEVDMTSGDLTFYYSDEPRVEYCFELRGIVVGEPRVEVREHGTGTTISTESYMILSGWSDCTIDVYIPENTVRELEIDMTSGNTNLEGMEFDKLNINMTSGDTNIYNTTARELEYDATSGSADIDGSFTYISVDVTSGTTSVSTAIQSERVELSLTSGRAKLGLPEDISGFTVDYERTSGSIDSDFDYSGDDNEHSGVLTYGDGACRIEADMVSGNIDIEKR